jgi:DNA polymerase-3 subunit epsilon
MAKLLFLDTETTGTEPKIHGIIQIAAILEVDGQEAERFEVRIRPWDGCVYDPDALKVSGATREAIEVYVPEPTAWVLFIQFLGRHISKYYKDDKAFLVGYNAPFDDQFLRALAERCGDKYLGSYKWPDLIDVRGLAALRLMSVRGDLPNFKLGTVAQTVLGKTRMEAILQERGLHDAMADIDITRELFQQLAWGEF